jgi:hypothetical protein
MIAPPYKPKPIDTDAMDYLFQQGRLTDPPEPDRTDIHRKHAFMGITPGSALRRLAQYLDSHYDDGIRRGSAFDPAIPVMLWWDREQGMVEASIAYDEAIDG